VNQDPTNLLQMLSRREVARYLAGADMTNLMSSGRSQAADTLRQAIQAQSNERRLGVNITFVGLQDIHPPVKVASDYEKVISERESREVSILQAQSDAIMTNAQARGISRQRLAEAEANKFNAGTNAAARANLFASQSLAFAAAPGLDGVYEHRSYLDVLGKSTRDADKKIINATSNTKQIFEFNEEPKLRDFSSMLTIPKATK
jgi:regulator of protease activity HflC (stomatin/prohibitin superfamily)